MMKDTSTSKETRLKAKGWRSGSAQEFLGLTDKEAALIKATKGKGIMPNSLAIASIAITIGIIGCLFYAYAYLLALSFPN